jgi:hypothetical protein
VIEVVNEAGGELVYTFHLPPGPFTPTVPGPGSYTVRLYDPETKREEVRRGVRVAG